MAKKNYRAWLYHEKEQPRIFEGEEAAEAALDDGWYDSPAKVPGFLGRVGIENPEPTQVQAIGEVVDTGVELANLIANIEGNSKPQNARIIELAYGEDWTKGDQGKLNAADLKLAVQMRLQAEPPKDESQPAS